MSIGFLALTFGCNVSTIENVQCMSKGKAEIKYFKDKYKAGDKIKIKVETKDLDREDILIVWDGKFGEQYFEKKVYSEDFIFNFPDSISNYSGFASIKVVHCNKILNRKKTYITSLHPKGAIESYLGPKTLAIDQNMESMLCLIPTDKFGNALEITDTVLFNTKYNNMAMQSVSKGIENLVTYIKIENNQQVGKVLLGAKCDDTYIDEQEVAIVQGPMKKVKINVVEMHPFSDQRQLVHLNTDVIYDAKNNIVADGTSIIFVVYENDEVIAQYQTYTVSGIANVYIENPKSTAEWKVSISGAPQKASIRLNFEDNIESIPVRIEKNHLVIGPVIGSLDQYIPDGTEVNVVFNYSISETADIEHGFARLKIPVSLTEADELICEVEINGQKVKLIY